MTVSAYMRACLHDPLHGYYATRPGLGADFTTAPEISQVFGELIGLWAAHEWRAIGAPEAFSLVELGPGRGTMMADALRATAAAPGFQESLRLNLVEASPALRAAQAERLHPHAPIFKDSLAEVAPGATLILANEFLDCLPARQFVEDAGVWRERVVGLDEVGELAFGLAVDQPPGDVATRATAALEVQPGLDTLVENLKRRSDAGNVFRALFIDYGPSDHAPGDTLRAYRRGAQERPLACPGEADLTVDVDFGRLRRLAEAAGLSVAGPVEQGAFLQALGAQARLDALIKSNPADPDRLFDGVRKLVDPAEMGARFKAICLSSPGLPAPAGL
ncbi:MAG: SAM-dependent methyltransferase [Pseudomonadota bacterium]